MFIETSDVRYNPALPLMSGDGRNAIGSFPCKGGGWEGVSSKLIISAALSAALLLSGCAYIPHDQIVKGTTTASPAPAAPPHCQWFYLPKRAADELRLPAAV